MLTALAVAMTVPALVDAAAGDPDWLAFVQASGAALFLGGALALAARRDGVRLDMRGAFLLTVLGYVIAALACALPFWFSHLGLDFTDAVFESISGLTSTGATILESVEASPPGILVWRAMLN